MGDAIKILNTNQKPWYKGAQDIGGWYKILDIISVIAVTTNALLAGLGYAAVPKALSGGKLGTSFNVFIFCIVLEHFVLIFKFLLAEIIPDMPQEVTKKLARQEFLKEQVMSSLDKKPQFLFEINEDEVAKFDYDNTFKNNAIIEPDELNVTYELSEKELIEAATKQN